jgi:hypothetical protein
MRDAFGMTLVVALVVAALGVYFLVRSPQLAHDEATTFPRFARLERGRRIAYRACGVFLLAIAFALLMDSVN